MAEEIDRASISQGSQVTWCFRVLALKKPASSNLSSRRAYSSTKAVHLHGVVCYNPELVVRFWNEDGFVERERFLSRFEGGQEGF